MPGPLDRVDEAMLIGGAAVHDRERLEVRNPARPSEIVGTVPKATPEDIDRAVLAARAAQPAWAALSFRERAAALDQALTAIDSNYEARATLLVRENGKPYAEALGELQGIPRRQRIALSFADQLDAGAALDAPRGRSFVSYRPYGVVVSIVPWNSPVSLAFTQVVAALLTGNGVVLKPPETCPLTLIDTARSFAAALPPGLLNVVTGLPADIGDALTTHPGIGKIGFTGSIRAARQIMSNAAGSIKGVTLELGGNDAAILLDDVELGPDTIKILVGSTLQITGQVCMAIKRFYVPRRRHDEFVEAFGRAIDRLVIGDGLQPDVTMGPLHTAQGLAKVRELVTDAAGRGATVTEFGRVLDPRGFEEGHFMRPVIVTNVPDDAPLMTEEQFGPALPVSVYNDVDEAVARANDTIYGLSGSVWSSDVERAIDVARRIEAGQVWVNAHGPSFTNHLAPYGGVKQSGIGRKSGFEGLLEYVQSQTITTREL